MAKVRAAKAAQKLAKMYGLDLADVPVNAKTGDKVTLEDVRRYVEAQKKPDSPPEPETPVPDAPQTPPALAAGEDLTGASVMVKGKFMGTVVGPVTASDGKKLWRVKSPSHSPDCETVAYALEDLTKVIG